ncbi:MAG: hypothetical protein GY863_21895 [bacterium]|nr:hypothetical protein [bacterium]
MLKRLIISSICISFLITSCSLFENEISFKTNSLEICLNNKGEISKLIDKETGNDYLPENTTAPLISLRIQGEMYYPESIRKDDVESNIFLAFENGIEAEIKVESKETHLTFELSEISETDAVELIVWGPYPTSINKIIGETVGIVRGTDYAIGIQALNPKTLGGFPWHENDCPPQIDIFEQNDYTDLSEKGKRYVLYRVEAAMPTDYGSSLQAYCRNRTEERVIENWGHTRYTAPPFEDGGIIGSKIALFGCPVNKTLETVAAIELDEGLPHPMIDGEWGKTSTTASAAYVIMDFGESDIDEALEVTKEAGLRYLYHSGPFENWGHFNLNQSQFPDGNNSLKNCVEKAGSQDVMLGVHILSNFITTNDPYVTPVPDRRLAKVGTSTITSDIDKKQTEIPIESPDFFNQYDNNHLKTAVIGNELIRYGSVSENTPWTLLDCQRGAFETAVSAHNSGDEISKLADHAYKVFLTDPELTIEMSKNIAVLYNQTGLRQISFDGLEGNRSTGMGNYGEILFTKTWFDNLNDEIKQHYIADASRTSHYFWHMYTRMNWGEPWYAGFRESQTEYRLKNQKYFKRNLMPGMLGWFKMTPETSIEDIEWMLARSAAFNAGYAFVTSFEAIAENKHSETILSLLGEWERVRLSGAFTEEQKTRMEDIDNEFHLEPAKENEWDLYQVYSYKFRHLKTEKQPGEPAYSEFSFENPASEQNMNFIITAVDSDIENIRLEIDSYKEFSLPVLLKAGETVKYTGGNEAIIYSSNWRELRKVDIDPAVFTLSQGEHKITFDCTFTGGTEPLAKLEIRITGPAERVRIN